MTEKILLVEDDPMIGEAVVNALADAGKAADWARSGWEATGFLSENKYDALLLDLGLPGKDGMSVLRELRAKDSETPVVILTARDGLDDRLAGLDAGADDYVVKPFHICPKCWQGCAPSNGDARVRRPQAKCSPTAR